MKPLVFRSTAARVGAWAWLAFAALNLLDIVWRGRNVASLVAAAVLLAGCGAAYVFGLRPRIAADDVGLQLRNILRDVWAPWPAVRKIEAADAVIVEFTGPGRTAQTARAWVLQSSPRARARYERQARRADRRLPAGVAEQIAKRTPTQYAVEQLNELGAPHRRKAKSGNPGKVAVDKDQTTVTGAVTWSIPALAALVLPGAFLAVMLVIALL